MSILVFDINFSHVLAGYGGEDAPRKTTLETSGELYGPGGIVNIESYLDILNKTLYEEDSPLLASPDESFTLVSSVVFPHGFDKKIQSKLVECIFECNPNLEGLFFSKSAVLSTYASGKTSGVVVELGERLN